MSRLSSDPITSIRPLYEMAEQFMVISLVLAVCALAFRWWFKRHYTEDTAGGLPRYVATRGVDEERFMVDVVTHPDAETPAEWAARHQAEGWTVRKIEG